MSGGRAAARPLDATDLSASISVLAPFVEAGVFGSYEVNLVATFLRLHPTAGDELVLALALAGRAPRFGHVCAGLELRALPSALGEDDEGMARALPWPDARQWAHDLIASELVAEPDVGNEAPLRPLVWDLGLLYLQRYWRDEVAVANDLTARCAISGRPPTDGAGGAAAAPSGAGLRGTEVVLDLLFPPADGERDGDEPDRQRLAAARGLREGVSVIAGGPGTGKTHTVARLLAAAHLVASGESRSLSVGLAAPTGKAAHRMHEAVVSEVDRLEQSDTIVPEIADRLRSTPAVTVHRLLGSRFDTAVVHHRQNPLPHDLVIIDETSMVSLPMLADLLDALRPEARLVLVGDPSQLSSIEAGTVMGDLVGPLGVGKPAAGVLAGRVTVLERMFRFAEGSTIAALARAVRLDRAADALDILSAGGDEVLWVDPEDPAAVDSVSAHVAADASEMVRAARGDDAEAALTFANRSKVLCATRRGPQGLGNWTDRIRTAVLSGGVGIGRGRRWYVGRPVMVTANDPLNDVANGDVGVVVNRDGRSQLAMAEGPDVRYVPTARLDAIEDWWAMTIHKAQGSEFEHAVVVLPDVDSPILSRELLYTAVTRAKKRLTLVVTEDIVRTAMARPVARASGLGQRLWADARESGPEVGREGWAG